MHYDQTKAQSAENNMIEGKSLSDNYSIFHIINRVNLVGFAYAIIALAIYIVFEIISSNNYSVTTGLRCAILGLFLGHCLAYFARVGVIVRWSWPKILAGIWVFCSTYITLLLNRIFGLDLPKIVSTEIFIIVIFLIQGLIALVMSWVQSADT